MPLTGGVSICLTMLFGTYLLETNPLFNEVLAIAMGLFLLGVLDDLRNINPWVRLLSQFVAGAALVYCGIIITNMGNLLAMGDIPLLGVAGPLTVVAMVGLSNAFNMIDGIDGLAGSMLAIPNLALYLLAINSGYVTADLPLLMLTLTPIAVFLVFNLGPNNRLLPKMFLGDAGSVTLGFLAAVSLVYFSQGENALIEPVTALWFVAVPLMDMLFTLMRRAKRGSKLMQADRSHVHYKLIDMGLSPRQALIVLVGAGAIFAVIGLLLENIPAYLSLACYFALFGCHCLFVMRSEAGAITKSRKPPGKVTGLEQ